MEVLTQTINISINLQCSAEIINFEHIQAHASAYIVMRHVACTTLQDIENQMYLLNRITGFLINDIYKGNEESAYLYIT